MRPITRDFWINAALVAGAIVLPFGSVLLLAAAALKKSKTAKTANRTNNEYDEWWKLRALERSSAHAWHQNGDRRVPVRVD